MNIHRALADIAAIRTQLDRTVSYRSFRSLATGFSALIVVMGSALQSYWSIQPAKHIDAYLAIWLGVASVSAAICLGEMVIRGVRSDCPQVWRIHRKLIRNLLPTLIVGAVLTFLIANQAHTERLNSGLIWALPGIWAMIFGMGLFSCQLDLPEGTCWVASFYLVAGIICLLLGPLTESNGDWSMVLLFGFGQVFLGKVLYWNSERNGLGDESDD